MKSRNTDMLNAPLLSSIISYTIPLILTSILQLLFNAADLMVEGNFSSNPNAVGAVASTNAIINLIVNLFIGLSVGSGVALSHALGSDDKIAAEKVIHTSLPVSIVGGLIITVIGVFFSGTFLTWMDTPDDLLAKSTAYMQIYFLGITFNMVYNFCSSILRAVGDTKSPLIFLTIAGVINFLLNLYFVLVHGMDVEGVAWATTISQGISAVLVVITLMKRDDSCRLNLKKLCVDKRALKKIMAIGIPAGIQGSLFSISNVILQSGINSFNSPDLNTGNGASSNLEGFVFVAMNSLQLTAMNFVGQNIGAKRMDRVHKIYRLCLISVFVVGIVLGGTIVLFDKQLLSLYIPKSPEAIAYASVRLKYMCLPYFVCGMMNVATGVLRGMGSSTPPMVITILGICVFRIGWIYSIFQIPQFHTPEALYISYLVSWVLTFIAQHTAILLLQRKIKKTL